MPAKRKRANLRGKTATIGLVRNGVSIEIADVNATDAGLVAAELLDVFRQLTARFPELTVELGPIGAGDGIVVPDEEGTEDGTDPINGRKKPMGFH